MEQALLFLLSVFFQKHAAFLHAKSQWKKYRFSKSLIRDDLDLVTVACLRAHLLLTHPHRRSHTPRASVQGPEMRRLHDEIIKTEYVPTTPSFLDFLARSPTPEYTETGISTTFLPWSRPQSSLGACISVHIMLSIHAHNNTIHAIPKRAIGRSGIDASVFVEPEVGPIATEYTLLKEMSELLKQFDSFTFATCSGSVKVMSTHYSSVSFDPFKMTSRRLTEYSAAP
jgi:hypothetical protein